MPYQIFTVGAEKTPVVVIDSLVTSPEALVEHAAQMAPFPVETSSYYPGVRRRITNTDGPSYDYVQAVCSSITPLLTETYGLRSLTVVDASFSIVTTPPERLVALQSRPHADSYNPGLFAIVHYLSRTPSGGTGFYRHFRSGFETLTDERASEYNSGLDKDALIFGPPSGYFSGNADGFIEIGKVDAVFNRAVIYPSNLLHSGLIPEGFAFNPDPRQGRLTANIFVEEA